MHLAKFSVLYYYMLKYIRRSIWTLKIIFDKSSDGVGTNNGKNSWDARFGFWYNDEEIFELQRFYSKAKVLMPN